MRIYETCREMHSEEKRNLHEMGTKVHPQTMQDKEVSHDPKFETLELAPAVFTILSGKDRDEWLIELGCNLKWANQEFWERVRLTIDGDHGINPGQAWRERAEVWKPFLHNDQFSYTYSERFGRILGRRYGALQKVCQELQARPDTRQAVLPVFCTPLDMPNMGGIARIPCSMHYQFMIRRHQLDLMYVMRSCDFVTHFPYDIWMALELQSAVATKLGYESGRFTFFAGSLHIYAKDADPGVF